MEFNIVLLGENARGYLTAAGDPFQCGVGGRVPGGRGGSGSTSFLVVLCEPAELWEKPGLTAKHRDNRWARSHPETEAGQAVSCVLAKSRVSFSGMFGDAPSALWDNVTSGFVAA